MSVLRTSVIPLVSFARSVEATDGLFSRTCAQCGKPYKSIFATRGRFCGHPCIRQWQKLHSPRRRACVKCGEFYTPKKGTKDSRYCGTKCRHTAERIAHPIPCGTCGRVFVRKPGQAANVKYCSPACSSAGRARGVAAVNGVAASVHRGHDLLDHAPDGSHLDRWFRRLTADQLRSVWVAAVVEQFGEGRRAELAAALRTVRERLQAAPVSSDIGIAAA